ncbi:MAG: gliding motility-associated ABC transporter permease subunit GldF [Saprospiraceae bacterium]|nr:gliding motility-associated ABC transporter permease subunit GldF [Saprospiraceae bacterium]
MFSIFKKEIHAFFSSLIGYLVIGVFLISVGLFMWVFSDTSVLEYNFATMDQLFSIAPLVFLFLIPAITMRSFAEESASGTIEFLYTKPLKNIHIVGGKYLANFLLVIFALIPTLIYYFSIYQLGSPVGNLDSGAIIGSYIGLVFLAGAFVAIGMFASALTDNQIIAFILGAFLCFFFHWAFVYIARMPVFATNLDLFIQKMGINYHYNSISKGLIDTRDLVYFISVISVFIFGTVTIIENRK